MKQFDFRLQKVLEYRELAEGWAKEAYLDARATRLEADVMLAGIARQREDLFHEQTDSLEDLQTIDLRLNLLDAKATQQEAIIQVLRAEEDDALAIWHEKKRDVEALTRLRDTAYEEWDQEMSRQEQALIDEWTNHRRAA